MPIHNHIVFQTIINKTTHIHELWCNEEVKMIYTNCMNCCRIADKCHGIILFCRHPHITHIMNFTLDSRASIFQVVNRLYPGVRSHTRLERMNSKCVWQTQAFTKWLPVCRCYFHMHFVKRNCIWIWIVDIRRWNYSERHHVKVKAYQITSESIVCSIAC